MNDHTQFHELAVSQKEIQFIHRKMDEKEERAFLATLKSSDKKWLIETREHQDKLDQSEAWMGFMSELTTETFESIRAQIQAEVSAEQPSQARKKGWVEDVLHRFNQFLLESLTIPASPQVAFHTAVVELPADLKDLLFISKHPLQGGDLLLTVTAQGPLARAIEESGIECRLIRGLQQGAEPISWTRSDLALSDTADELSIFERRPSGKYVAEIVLPASTDKDTHSDDGARWYISVSFQ